MRIIIKCLSILLFALMLTAGNSSCKKNKDSHAQSANDDDTGGNASDFARLQLASNDAIDLADAAFLKNDSNLRLAPTVLSSCVIVTRDTMVIPHKITIDFG